MLHDEFNHPGFLPGIFLVGGGAKSVVMQIFLLFSDQILGGKESQSGANCLTPPSFGGKPVTK